MTSSGFLVPIAMMPWLGKRRVTGVSGLPEPSFGSLVEMQNASSVGSQTGLPAVDVEAGASLASSWVTAPLRFVGHPGQLSEDGPDGCVPYAALLLSDAVSALVDEPVVPVPVPAEPVLVPVTPPLD